MLASRNATPFTPLVLLALLVGLLIPAAAQATPVALDTSWNAGGAGVTPCNGVYWCVGAIAEQADGKILVAGSASNKWNGWPTVSSSTHLFRLNADGTRDASFPEVAVSGDSGPIFAIGIGGDGTIFVGGNFTTVTIGGTDTARQSLFALNPDGTLKTSFGNPALSSPSNVYDLVPTAAGGVVVGGDLGAGGGGECYSGKACYLARFSATGVRDTSFTGDTRATSASGTVMAIAPAPGGGYYVGGLFSAYKTATANRIIRIEDDGDRDATFTGTGANDNVWAIAVDATGRVVLGGQFTTYNGCTVGRLARASSTGTCDSAFSAGAGWGVGAGIVYGIAVDSSGRIVVGGASFTSVGLRDVGGTVTPTSIERIFALNTDGTGDADFNAALGAGATGACTPFCSSKGVRAIVPTGTSPTDSGILIGGGFTGFAGTAQHDIVRMSTSYRVLTATKAGTGSGTITSSPATIDCGTVCTGQWTPGTSVTLTATPAAGSTFTGWSGACTGTGTCTLTLTSDTTATATFAANESRATAGATPTAAPTAAATPTARVVTASPAGPSAVLDVRVSGAGRLDAVGRRTTTGGSGSPTITACTARRSVAKAGTYALTCRLDAATRALRATRPVRLVITTTFTPASGRAVVRRSVVVFAAIRPNAEPVTG